MPGGERSKQIYFIVLAKVKIALMFVCMFPFTSFCFWHREYLGFGSFVYDAMMMICSQTLVSKA